MAHANLIFRKYDLFDRFLLKHSELSEDNLNKTKLVSKESFKEVFDSHFNALCAFGYKYVKDKQVAEDLVQEVYVALWNKREDFAHENAIKGFLYTSVRNSCLNHLKHQAVLEKHEGSLIYELESEQFFSHHVIEEEAFNQLYTEIHHLPKAAQKIMLLALKGLKNKEIASTLDISENTVKTQKKIAYAKLKEKLSHTVLGIFLSF